MDIQVASIVNLAKYFTQRPNLSLGLFGLEILIYLKYFGNNMSGNRWNESALKM